MSKPRPCVVCREQFEPVRRDARYCGAACRQYAWRRRQHQGTVEGGPAVTVSVGEGGNVYVSSRQAAAPRTTSYVA